MAYNQQAVREMLSAAFNAGDVRTMAFDLFPQLYSDFGSGISKTDMIQQLVDNARRNGRVAEIIEYVKKNNEYQYKQFAHQLMQPDAGVKRPSSSVTAAAAQRLQHLEGLIQKAQDLLHEYEEDLEFEGDRRQIQRIEREIQRQKNSIAGYRQEIDELTHT